MILYFLTDAVISRILLYLKHFYFLLLTVIYYIRIFTKANTSKGYALFVSNFLIAWDIELKLEPNSCTMANNFISSEISISHLNVRNIKPKLNGVNVKLEFICHDLALRFNIITGSETWLSDTDNVQDYLTDGFQTPFALNRPTHAGGVICWVRNDIVAKRRKDLELNELEALWLELGHKNNKFLLCTAYWPPGLSNFYGIFQSAIDKTQQSNTQDYIIIGNLNSDPNTDKLNTIASLNRLKMYINQPTRITDRSSSILVSVFMKLPFDNPDLRHNTSTGKQ